MNVDEYYKFQAKARKLSTPEDFSGIYAYYNNLYQRLLSGWLPAHRDAVIYELACGPGLMLKWLQDEGYINSNGTDSSESQIRLALAMGLKAEQKDSLSDLQAKPPDSIDCIIALNFYEHLPKEVFLDFLKAAHRVLRPGGRVILQGPNADGPLVGRNLFNDITHQWAYTSISMNALLQMTGFRAMVFQDDVLESLFKRRLLKLPIAIFSRFLLRIIFASACKEHVKIFGSFMWTLAVKDNSYKIGE